MIELQTLESRLAGLLLLSPFAVPEGYFAQLAESLSAGVHYSMSADPLFPGYPKTLPFEVSDTYFTTLADVLVQTSASSTAKDITTPFEAPAGYFENLPAELLQTVQQSTGQPIRNAKTITFRPVWSRIVRMAAAAALVLGIGLGTYRYLHPATPENIVASQLEKLDEQAINTYLEQNVDDFDSEILESAVASSHISLPAAVSALDEAAIEAYFQENAELAPAAQPQTL